MHSHQEFAGAVNSYRKSLRHDPSNVAIWNNLGAALIALGEVPQALLAFKTAVSLVSKSLTPRSNLLYGMLHDWSANAQSMFEAHVALAPKPPSVSLLRLRSCGSARRLRIGYLSPGFGAHAISQFSLPPVHDPKVVDVFCYSTRIRPDHSSKRYHSACPNWFDLAPLSDEEAAQLIGSHELDLLIDRGGYCAENRIALLARRLASIQVSTADYPVTLGMPAVRYHLTDSLINPVSSQRFYLEKLVNLPSAMCYQPAAHSPSVSLLPSLKNSFVTFAAFHRLFKLSPALLEAYAGILKRVPRSRLLLHHTYGPRPVVPANLKVRVNQTLASFGVSPRRLRWVGTLPHRRSMALYRETDIALGAFPCGGVTTTAEALFMGNPVVAWYNEEPRSRHSLSMLAAVGLEDLAVDSAARFVDKAVELASDLPRLSGLRRTLRKRVLASRLCDQAAYAQSLEAAYRQMIAETRLAAKV